MVRKKKVQEFYDTQIIQLIKYHEASNKKPHSEMAILRDLKREFNLVDKPIEKSTIWKIKE